MLSRIFTFQTSLSSSNLFIDCLHVQVPKLLWLPRYRVFFATFEWEPIFMFIYSLSYFDSRLFKQGKTNHLSISEWWQYTYNAFHFFWLSYSMTVVDAMHNVHNVLHSRCYTILCWSSFMILDTFSHREAIWDTRLDNKSYARKCESNVSLQSKGRTSNRIVPYVKQWIEYITNCDDRICRKEIPWLSQRFLQIWQQMDIGL